MFVTIIAFVLILGLLVLVHELGHFITAIKLKVGVEEFGIGFPPRLFYFKRGGIIYSLNLWPIGGFVKIKGENGDEADNPNSFVNQAAWKKAAILCAGVTMNFLFAIVALALAFYIGLPQSIDPQDNNKAITNKEVMVALVEKDSPADVAGVELGDEIIMVGDSPVTSSTQVYDYIAANREGEINIKVLRNEQEFDYKLQAQVLSDGGEPLIGVGIVDTGVIKYNIFASLWQAIVATASMIVLILVAFWDLLVNLVSQGKVTAELSGPVGVAVLTGQIVKLGFVQTLQFMAILSINLGVINILPFPALDGGRLLFVVIEKIARRKLSTKVEAIVHNSGFIALILLLVIITFRDIDRYGASIWAALKGIF